jgi:phosphopantothenate synthetase
MTIIFTACYNLYHFNRLETDIASVMEIMEEKKSAGLMNEDVSLLFIEDGDHKFMFHSPTGFIVEVIDLRVITKKYLFGLIF